MVFTVTTMSTRPPKNLSTGHPHHTDYRQRHHSVRGLWIHQKWPQPPLTLFNLPDHASGRPLHTHTPSPFPRSQHHQRHPTDLYWNLGVSLRVHCDYHLLQHESITPHLNLVRHGSPWGYHVYLRLTPYVLFHSGRPPYDVTSVVINVTLGRWPLTSQRKELSSISVCRPPVSEINTEPGVVRWRRRQHSSP